MRYVRYFSLIAILSNRLCYFYTHLQSAETGFVSKVLMSKLDTDLLFLVRRASVSVKWHLNQVYLITHKQFVSPRRRWRRGILRI